MSLIMTEKGRGLVSKAMTDEVAIQFTKLVATDTVYEADEAQILETIANPKQEVAITEVEKTDDTTVTVAVTMNNMDLSEGYYIRCIGIYAKGGNDEEILFGVAVVEENADYMPMFVGKTVSGIEYKFYINVGNAENVLIEVNPDNFVTFEKIEELKAEVDELKETVDELSEYTSEKLEELSGAKGCCATLENSMMTCGASNTVSGSFSSAVGFSNTASEYASAVGDRNTASGYGSAAFGFINKPSGFHASAIGIYNKADATSASAIGYGNNASAMISTAVGCENTVPGSYGSAFGHSNTASSSFSSALGGYNTASGRCSTAIGHNVVSNTYGCTAIGHCNNGTNGSATEYSAANDMFVVGVGYHSNSLKNALRIIGTGTVYGGTYNSSGADYAEYFEWLDGNPSDEDRIGRFVTMRQGKIQLADPDDTYIVGIISGNGSVIGDAQEDEWSGRFEKDIYGRLQYEWKDVEHTEIELVEDENSEMVEVEKKVVRNEYHMKENPEMKKDEKYIPRSQRSEWDIVGLMGKLIVIDDGTCVVDGFCSVGENGIATDGDKYLVMERLGESHIKILVK